MATSASCSPLRRLLRPGVPTGRAGDDRRPGRHLRLGRPVGGLPRCAECSQPGRGQCGHPPRTELIANEYPDQEQRSCHRGLPSGCPGGSAVTSIWRSASGSTCWSTCWCSPRCAWASCRFPRAPCSGSSCPRWESNCCSWVPTSAGTLRGRRYSGRWPASRSPSSRCARQRRCGKPCGSPYRYSRSS